MQSVKEQAKRRQKSDSVVPATVASGSVRTVPRIYYLQPGLAGPLDRWDTHLDRIRAMGFDHLLVACPFASAAGDLFAIADLDRLHPSLGHDGPADRALARLATACRSRGLCLLLDLVVDRAAVDGALIAALPDCWHEVASLGLDPRSIRSAGTVGANVDEPASRDRLVRFWQERLGQWRSAGIAGVRCHDAHAVSATVWRDILAPVRAADPGWMAIGWIVARPRSEALAAAAVFDHLTSSAAWWDGRAPWLLEEYRELGRHCSLLAFPDDPFGQRLAARVRPAQARSAHELALQAASTLADGWLMPMGFELGALESFTWPSYRPEDFAAIATDATFDLTVDITAANARAESLRTATPGWAHLLAGRNAPATLVHRAGRSDGGFLVAINPQLDRPVSVEIELAAARVGATIGDGHRMMDLPPGGASLVPLKWVEPVIAEPSPRVRPSEVGEGPRIAIEAISPAVDGGRFPVKRVTGDLVTVEADIFADGHEVLAAELRWRAADEQRWSTTRMTALLNDCWEGSFPVLRPGRYVFAIEAWWDHFATFRRDLTKKRDAGLELTLEIAEGRLLVEQTLPHAPKARQPAIRDLLRRLEKPGAHGVELLLSDELRIAMDDVDHRPFAVGRDKLVPIEVDREAAAFASWYELFPRSITDSPLRHGTFDDVIGRLPAIRDMGFDVLYFPPIHPIGLTNRKGRNNSLTPGPDDHGSPYAIGSAEGGHEAIHPLLGTKEDFRRLVRTAADHGLEIALDFAIQCSPDHPWLKQHPGWFQWRPDGSMRYAENPPKKYEDIVNVDFYAEGAKPALWLALRDVVQGWVDEGVRTFRVDNPHTKPFPFWEWLIADIRSRDPGVIFLAEAFTRPKVMYRLGKVGFSQSYTYFTWRKDKAELAAYLTELNSPAVRDLYRPHFFVNTPDINPYFLQTSGRPGFLIRAALASTLSGLWGVYSGFELCEAAPVPGKEEYLDSEKYEVKPRDWHAPGNIITEITKLNEIRKSHPALQTHLGVTFYETSSDKVLYYGKRVPGDQEIVLVAVGLDPHAAETATIEIPLWELGLPDHGSVAVEDLMVGHRFTWTGKLQTIHLDPAHLPFAIWCIAPLGATSP